VIIERTKTAINNYFIIVVFNDDAHLSINFDHGFTMAWINLVSAVRAKTDPTKIKCMLIASILCTRCIAFRSYKDGIALRMSDTIYM